MKKWPMFEFKRQKLSVCLLCISSSHLRLEDKLLAWNYWGDGKYGTLSGHLSFQQPFFFTILHDSDRASSFNLLLSEGSKTVVSLVSGFFFVCFVFVLFVCLFFCKHHSFCCVYDISVSQMLSRVLRKSMLQRLIIVFVLLLRERQSLY